MENITTARDLARFALQNSVNVIGLETKPTNPAEHVLQREVGRIFGLKYASLDLDHVKETCKQDILGCARLSAKSCWSLSERAECLSEKLENDGSCDSCSGRDGPTVQLVQLLCPATCGITEFDEKASPVAIARRMKKALFCSEKREPSKEKISDTFDEYYASLEEEGKDNSNKQRGNDGYQENDITKQLR